MSNELSAETRLSKLWDAVSRTFDIEPRAFFDAEAPRTGDWTPEEMLVHHLWKRDPQVQELEAKLKAAEAKAAQYEQDWYTYKHETGITLGKQAQRIAELESRVKDLTGPRPPDAG